MATKLTERQQRLISSFLQKVDKEGGDLSAGDRALMLSSVRSGLDRELAAAGKETVSDEELASAMLRCRRSVVQDTKAVKPIAAVSQPDSSAPARAEQPEQPEEPAVKRRRRSATPLASEARGWLGVCQHLADTLGVGVRPVRVVFVLLGLVTGPAALLIYLCAYLVIYTAVDTRDKLPVDLRRFMKALGTSLMAVLALSGAARLILFLVATLYERFLAGPPILGGWNWLAYYQDPLLFGFGVLVLPISALSALPLANDWDYTARKVAQAGLAIYLVALSIGIASNLVGTLLLVVDEVVG